MTLEIRRVDYYNIAVQGDIAEVSRLLTAIAESGVDFLAYRAIPIDPQRTQFTLFPMDGSILETAAKRAGLELDGPYSAVILTGDEEPGALAGIYKRLFQAGIQVEESSGIAHINEGYGVVLYLQREDCDKAVAALSR